jgi:hypothetical protein
VQIAMLVFGTVILVATVAWLATFPVSFSV